MPEELIKRPRSTLLAIVVLWAVFYASFTLVTPPLLDDADSVHAEVAREMLLRHDFVTLYANGIRYLEKAPMLYWTMAACMRSSQGLGYGSPAALATAARVPLAATVMALALLVEAFARRIFGSARSGLYAALILLSSPGVFLFTRILLPDGMVCLWLTLALYAFWRSEGQARPDRRLSVLFAAACALNGLTKGLIGVVFPLAIVALYLVGTRGAKGTVRRIRELHPISSVAVFFAVAAPWHVLAALANPTQGHPGGLSFTLHPAAGQPHWTVPLPTDGNVHGWLWFYFVNEQVLRYLNLRVPHDYDTVPLWLFWGLCVVWMMPWSAFSFSAFARLSTMRFAAWRTRALDPQSSGWLLMCVWTAFVLLFFVCSTRQEYYVLPAFPAISILIAGWLGLDPEDQQKHGAPEPVQVRRADLRSIAALVVPGALFAAASLYLILFVSRPAANVDLAGMLQQNPGDYAMSMGHLLDLNAQALGLFRLPLALAAASLLVGPVIAYILRRRAHSHAAVVSLAAGAFGFLLAAHLGLQTFAPVLSSAQLAYAIAPKLAAQPGEPPPLIVIHQEFEFGSTLSFYLARPEYLLRNGRRIPAEPIHILTEASYGGTADYGRSSNLWYGSFFPDAPPIFETRETLAARWSGPQRIFLWQDLAGQPAAAPLLPGPVYVVTTAGGKEILSNRPDR